MESDLVVFGIFGIALFGIPAAIARLFVKWGIW